ncbi:MAG: GatB/YqeY domain-containing protein [bacterium]|nr:GatB/YqeY domain-containing protein [bacterium]
MPLEQKLKEDLKNAMKAGDSARVGVFRMLNSALQNRRIEKGKDAVLSDEEVMEVLRREQKKRKESVEAFEKGGRPELAENEKSELAIIEIYLPKQMSREEIAAAVEKIMSGLADKSNAGLVMKAVMQELKGKADGKLISEIVKEKLG